PENGGSEQMTVVTEDMAPGDKIPVHRHPHADELILIQSGTGKVTLGDEVQFVHGGAIVFIPRNTWIGMENVGNDHLKHIDVWSAPAFSSICGLSQFRWDSPSFHCPKPSWRSFVRGIRTTEFISESDIGLE